jgi:hypothetical protein
MSMSGVLWGFKEWGEERISGVVLNARLSSEKMLATVSSVSSVV